MQILFLNKWKHTGPKPHFVLWLWFLCGIVVFPVPSYSYLYSQVFTKCQQMTKSTIESKQCIQNSINLLVTKDIKKAKEVLDKSSPECSMDPPDELVNAIRYSSPSVYTDLHKITAKGAKWANTLLHKIRKSLDHEELPEECLLNNQNESCSLWLNNLNQFKERISDLLDMAFGPDLAQSIEAKALCLLLECPSTNPTEDIANLKTILDNLQSQSQEQCEDPAPGKAKTVNTGKPLHRSYTLKREPDGSFSIPLHINFSVDKDYDGPVPKWQASDYYMQQAQDCMKQANSKMLGPNGEKLNIVLKPSPPKESDSCLGQNAHEIKIGSQTQRSNAGKYASDIDCPTITHEILHLTGLCDEYKEKARGFNVDSPTGKVVGSLQSQPQSIEFNTNTKFKLAYDCRVTVDNSIMSNQYERWNNVFETGKDKSLLNPSQFSQLMYGTCEKKNKLFNECSALAYQSSVEEPDCLNKKQKCQAQNEARVDKKAEKKAPITSIYEQI